jgi:hypothetical protein
MSLTLQTLRYYPNAQIRQGADRVSAPTAGDSNRRPGLSQRAGRRSRHD